MLSVTGVYDGKTVLLTKPTDHYKKGKVIVTFLEDDDDENSLLRDFGMQNRAFDFWNNPAEDVYEDYAKKEQPK